MKYKFVCRECGGTRFDGDYYGYGTWCIDCGRNYSYYEYWELLENIADIMREECSLQNVDECQDNSEETDDFSSLWQ